MRRAGFAQPEFVREAWVSDEARALHQPQVRRVALAWELAEWRSADAVRPCALVTATSADYPDLMTKIEDAGLSHMALRVVEMTPPGAGEPILATDLAVGSPRRLNAFRAAWIERDTDRIGALLGYPACCRALFGFAAGVRGLEDYAWLIACASPGAVLEAEHARVHGLWQDNILLRRIGVRAIPHLPCSFACEPSRRLSEAMIAVARTHGHTEEMTWLGEMLDWPLSWSARHGVAEIRSPVLKLATHTDAMRGAYTVDWLGTGRPDQAARGLAFPYRAAEKTAGRGG
jgi:hypothetical protein